MLENHFIVKFITLGFHQLIQSPSLWVFTSWYKEIRQRKPPHHSNIILLLVWKFVYPQICWNPNPKRWCNLGGGALRRCFGHQGGAFVNGIILIKDTPQRLPAPPPCENTARTPSYKPGRGQGPHRKVTMLAPWSWIFQVPKLWEIKLCCL